MGDRFVLNADSFKHTEGELLDLKRKSFTVNPDNWDLAFMSQPNGRDVPSWQRNNQCMRFNHHEKLMLTKMMVAELEGKKSAINFSPHQVANYAYSKFK